MIILCNDVKILISCFIMIMFKVYYLLFFISNIISFLQMFWSNKIKEILVLVSIFNNYEKS